MLAAPAYRPHASGLLVPEDLSRARQTWTKDEWRLIDRATKLLTSRQVAFQFRCGDPACQDPKIEMLPDRASQTVTLRCGHADRVFQKAF